jgi:excisionase family DNA binding protein
MEDILTAEQVAQILQVHPFTVLKFIKQGKLKASKLGRVYRIRKSDVDSFLDNQVERGVKASEKPGVNKKKEPEEPIKKEKATSSEKKRAEGQGATESVSGIAKEEETVQITEIPKINEVTAITEIPEREERNDRTDIDHYVLELKAN